MMANKREASRRLRAAALDLSGQSEQTTLAEMFGVEQENLLVCSLDAELLFIDRALPPKMGDTVLRQSGETLAAEPFQPSLRLVAANFEPIEKTPVRGEIVGVIIGAFRFNREAR